MPMILLTAATGASVTANALNLPWSTEVTVVGLFVVLFIMSATGVIRWRWQDTVYMKLYHQEKANNERLIDSVEELANAWRGWSEHVDRQRQDTNR